MSRLTWGAISLSEVTEKWLFGDKSSAVLLSFELVWRNACTGAVFFGVSSPYFFFLCVTCLQLLVFIIVEIIPICMSLHIGYLQALATNDFNEAAVETRRVEEAPSLYNNVNDSVMNQSVSLSLRLNLISAFSSLCYGHGDEICLIHAYLFILEAGHPLSRHQHGLLLRWRRRLAAHHLHGLYGRATWV